MREAYFAKNNLKKWKLFEELLDKKQEIDARTLSDLYLEITDDLSFAKTFYPQSNIVCHLNMLAAIAHSKIYTTRKENKYRIITFYKYEFPLIFVKYHKQLLISFSIFLFFTFVGMFSAASDANFVRLVLGDEYVNTTLANIEKGDPMAIYKQANQLSMSAFITFNNIRVAVFAFLFGMFFSVGTLYIMMQNGIMLGSFVYFFFDNGLLWESSRTIWIHGTIEISVIIIASCAGLVLGNGLMSPKTYSRLEALKRSFNDGLKILLSTLPFFIIAGFMEGFVTRYTQMPDWLAITIIGTSFFLILYYYIIYPIKLTKTH